MRTRDALPQALGKELDEYKRRWLERAKKKEVDKAPPNSADPTVPAVDPIAAASIHDRLCRKFGLGDRPECRAKFYDSLVKIVSVKGQTVLDLISLAVAQSVGKRQPGRYFCACIKVLLLEHGVALAPQTEASQW